MTEQRNLTVGVIGAGVFGGHHARKLACTPGVTLAAVFDQDIGRAQALVDQTGGAAATHLAAWVGALDAVVVASPAQTHHAAALAALQGGAHAYVEKPLATSMRDGAELVSAAGKGGLVLACGHQERAVFGAMGLLGLPERPTAVEAVRLGTRSGRNEDVSCVLDLMIHDLDLALLLSGGEPFAVEGEGDEDACEADVTFADGMSATFRASRAAEARERRMKVVFPSGRVEVDFLARTFSNTTSFALDPDFAETAPGRDPLSASVDAWLAAVRGEGRPLATGEDALAALDLALAVEQAAGL